MPGNGYRWDRYRYRCGVQVIGYRCAAQVQVWVQVTGYRFRYRCAIGIQVQVWVQVMGYRYRCAIGVQVIGYRCSEQVQVMGLGYRNRYRYRCAIGTGMGVLHRYRCMVQDTGTGTGVLCGTGTGVLWGTGNGMGYRYRCGYRYR